MAVTRHNPLDRTRISGCTTCRCCTWTGFDHRAAQLGAADHGTAHHDDVDRSRHHDHDDSTAQQRIR